MLGSIEAKHRQLDSRRKDLAGHLVFGTLGSDRLDLNGEPLVAMFERSEAIVLNLSDHVLGMFDLIEHRIGKQLNVVGDMDGCST